MTDRPDEHPHDADLPTEPTESAAADHTPAAANLDASSSEPKPSRWDSVRPRGRLGQIAAISVAAASAVVIAGTIFMAGYAVGSEGGDEHHGHDGDGYSQGESDQHRGDQTEDGSRNGARDESGDESSHGGEEP